MDNRKNYYAVIMAGGVGSRFWPVSTPSNPKQFHDMLGTGQSLIQQTYHRLIKLIPKGQVLVATNERYRDLVLQHLPEMNPSQLLLEPAMRNTAPCILYSAMKINDLNEEAVMIVAPSDHYIEDEEEFVKNVKEAFDACQGSELLMTLGIKPSGPNTGYGYIQYDRDGGAVKAVKNFTEKPDLETAKKFVAQGDYLWNAGIFIWSAKRILQAFEEHLAEMFELFSRGAPYWNSEEEVDFISSYYQEAENVSIDYGIMEKAENVYVMATDFGWNDLGTWGSLFDKLNKEDGDNALVGGTGLFRSSRGNMVSTLPGKKVVLQGLDDYIVVDNGDTLLICPKSDEQEIKEISKEAEKRFEGS